MLSQAVRRIVQGRGGVTVVTDDADRAAASR